jgi:hypothetical protein
MLRPILFRAIVPFLPIRKMVRWILGAMLFTCLFVVSLPFERRYAKQFQEGAQHPGIQLIAGLLLLALAAYDTPLASLALLILFLWIADVQLLSSISLTRH